MSKLNNFLDSDKKVKIWPKKHVMKREVVKYIASKFEEEKSYTEKEVNQIIDQWHTFGDYFILRRSLIDYKYLSRTRDGAKYWKVKIEEDADLCNNRDNDL